VQLPPPLLQAISHPAGGRVVLVLGAGCSHEEPTNLPLTGELARHCHQQLVDNHVLAPGACAAPDDLSAVAEAVVAATGHQDALVEQFPPEAFRSAEVNGGYVIAAALLREFAVGNVMTLNFDLAASTALAVVGAGDVATLEGPEDHGRLSTRNLIFLHRNINRPPNDLILRRDALEHEWQGQWTDVVAQRVMASPVVVFAGLGSPAAVLIDTTRKIASAVGDAGGELYIVDPTPREHSRFFAALGIADENYFEVGWTAFMTVLGRRIATAQCHALGAACGELSHHEGLDEEDTQPLCERMTDLGIVALGRLRAAWALHQGSYMPHSEHLLPNFADIMLALAAVERIRGVVALVAEDGVVEFRSGQTIRGRILVCHGRGVYSRARLAGELQVRRQRLAAREPVPFAALVGGMRADVGELSVPSSIAREPEAASIVAPAETLELVLIDELRLRPELAEKLAA
jgi:hypothetical protein